MGDAEILIADVASADGNRLSAIRAIVHAPVETATAQHELGHKAKHPRAAVERIENPPDMGCRSAMAGVSYREHPHRRRACAPTPRSAARTILFEPPVRSSARWYCVGALSSGLIRIGSRILFDQPQLPPRLLPSSRRTIWSSVVVEAAATMCDTVDLARRKWAKNGGIAAVHKF
jgi:hypothetical protein